MAWGIIMTALTVFGMLLLLIVSTGGDDRPPVAQSKVEDGEPDDQYREAA